MPAGDDAFARKQQQKAEQKASREAQSFTNDLKLKAGDVVYVRFLEEGMALTFADFHRIPVEGSRFPRDFVCLNVNDDGTPCPACQHPTKDIAARITRGLVNVIQYNAPVLQRDADGRAVKDFQGNYQVVGYEDQVRLWRTSWTAFTMLREKDSHYRGLMQRVWQVKRVGSGMKDTQYIVEPQDPTVPSQPMTIADMSLAEKKYDLTKITTPLPYAELSQILMRGAMPAGQGPQPTFDRGMPPVPTAQSTFTGDAPVPRASAFQR